MVILALRRWSTRDNATSISLSCCQVVMSSVILTYSLQEERQKVLKNNKYCSYSANVALINLRDSGISKHVASKQMISLINNQLITRAGVNVCVMNKVGLGGNCHLNHIHSLTTHLNQNARWMKGTKPLQKEIHHVILLPGINRNET